MRLFEHPDFDQAIIRAAEHFRPRGLREAIIEKDYYVTEALRLVEQAAGPRIIFKGGTSLSKGWNLIERFSEDIDIFLDPKTFDQNLGKNGIDRELKKLRDAVKQHPALTFLSNESQTIGGFGRNDRFAYPQRFAAVGEIRNHVFVEAGTASGREPTEEGRVDMQRMAKESITMPVLGRLGFLYRVGQGWAFGSSAINPSAVAAELRS